MRNFQFKVAIALLYFCAFGISAQTSENTGNPGFLGKRMVAGYQYGYAVQMGGQPHRATDDIRGLSFVPGIRPVNVHGLFFERALMRYTSFRFSVNRFNAYAENKPTPSNYNFNEISFFNSENARVYESIKNEHFKLRTTQFSASFRFYGPFAPIGTYIELGGSLLTYATDQYEFTETRFNQPNEIVQSSGWTWTTFAELGYSKVLFDDFVLSYGMGITIRTLQAVLGYGNEVMGLYEFEEFNNLQDSFDDYARYHTITAKAFYVQLSLGYLF